MRPRLCLDVVLVVDLEGAHQHAQPSVAGGVLLDGVGAHATGFQPLAHLALDSACRQQVGGIVGQVAEVNKAPQGELRRTAVEGVGDHLGRQAQAADLDRVAQPLVLHGLGRRGDAHGGGSHDQLHVRVLVHQRQRLIVAVLRLVVAVDDVQQLQTGVGGIGLQHLLQGGDPGVLVGRIRRGRQHGELAAVFAEDVHGHVGHDAARLVKVHLGDEHLLAFRRGDGRVPGDDGHACVESLCGRRSDLVAGVVGDHDGVHALGSSGGHDLDLSGHAVLRRGAEELQITFVLKLGVSFLSALIGLVKDQDAQELGQQHHVHFLPRCGLHGSGGGLGFWRLGRCHGWGGRFWCWLRCLPTGRGQHTQDNQ